MKQVILGLEFYALEGSAIEFLENLADCQGNPLVEVFIFSSHQLQSPSSILLLVYDKPIDCFLDLGFLG